MSLIVNTKHFEQATEHFMQLLNPQWEHLYLCCATIYKMIQTRREKKEGEWTEEIKSGCVFVPETHHTFSHTCILKNSKHECSFISSVMLVGHSAQRYQL